MADPSFEDAANASANALNTGVDATATNAKDYASALSESSESARSAFQALSKAYQEVATTNVARLTEAMRSLSAVKSPTEYIELQQKLVKDGIAAAVANSEHIGKLTVAAFAVPFELTKNRVETFTKAAIN